jgi:hypothetical protein
VHLLGEVNRRTVLRNPVTLTAWYAGVTSLVGRDGYSAYGRTGQLPPSERRLYRSSLVPRMGVSVGSSVGAIWGGGGSTEKALLLQLYHNREHSTALAFADEEVDVRGKIEGLCEVRPWTRE